MKKYSGRTTGSFFARWAFLFAVGAWLLHPLFTARLYGTGDALWYADMLADYVEQLRAGIFPVLVGQTDFAFNGAVYPLRVAPLYQHLGGAIDAITFHHLGFFALQHAVLIGVGFGALISAYLCAAALLPRNKWTAAGLAVLYLSCPGALALVYVQDLQMSWVALPFLPIAFYGCLRSFSEDDTITWGCMAGGLSALWWAHAPIALWCTAIVGSGELIRLLTVARTQRAWTHAIYGGIAFAILAQYPFVSVSALHSGAVSDPSGGALPHPERIPAALVSAFPQCFLPLTRLADTLGDLQLGYGLWALAAVVVIVGIYRRDLRLMIVAAWIAVVLAVLLPIPHWSEFFWLKLAPETLRRLTFYWPMHRLYVILAALVTIGGAAALGIVEARLKWQRAVSIGLGVAVIWSCCEARHFLAAAQVRTASTEDSARKLLPENRLLMNHAYGLFAQLPEHYSNGVMDPEAELRLVDSSGREINLTDKDEPSPTQRGELIARADPNPGVFNLEPGLRLEPGHKYDLTFTFAQNLGEGVLQVVGTTLFREYALPHSGEAHAFGSGRENSTRLPLWTTQRAAEVVTLRYIPIGNSALRVGDVFARFAFSPRSAERPIQLESLVPLTVKVRSPQDAILQTPRMYCPGYRATVNGTSAAVNYSPDGLVTVAIPAGRSDVVLRYVAPLRVQISYWLSIAAGMAGLLVFAVLVAGKRIRGTGAASKTTGSGIP